MKTIKATAIAFAALMGSFAADAHAGIINLTGDSAQGFGGRVIANQYIGAGGKVRLSPQAAIAADEVVEGAITLDFDFRYQRHHVGLASFKGSNNGLFTLTNGQKSYAFGSHDLNNQGVITTDAFNGSLANGDWVLRLDNPSGGDPWAAFSVASTINVAAPGGGGNGGGAGNGGGGNGGGGQVPVPAPLTLIGAIALFGAWRRKRSSNA